MLVAIMAMILLLCSCDKSALPKDDVEYITIFTPMIEDQKTTVVVNDRDSIDGIITSINHGRSEPLKFRSDYRLEIKYKTDIKQVLVKDQYAKIDGKTFLLNENLGAKLKSLVEKVR